MEIGIWIAFALNIVFLLIAGHIALTKLFPKLKAILVAALGKDDVVNAVMYLFVAYTIIFVLKKFVDMILAIGNSYLNLFAMLNSGLELLILLLPYIQWLILGAVVVVGLKSAKK